MAGKIKALFLFTQNAGVSYYRLISVGQKMREHKNVEIAWSNYSPYDSEMIKWQNHLDHPGVHKQLDMLFSNADITVTGYFVNPKGLALIMAARDLYGKPILMEIDDLVMGNLPGYNSAYESVKAGGQFEWMCDKQLAMVDGIIVSTPYLKKTYEKYYDKQINIIPNGIDFELWDQFPYGEKDLSKVKIGFAGSPNHTGDIRLIKPVIEQILKEYPSVEFHFLGCHPDFLKGKDRVIFHEGFYVMPKLDKYFDDLQMCYPQKIKQMNWDIGIAPLKQNLFNFAKSNLRWLEYSAAKIPCVASDIEHFHDTVTDGKDGFLAKDETDWYQKLTLLIKDAELRKRIGQAGYDTVKRRFNVRLIAKQYINVLQQYKKGNKK